MEAYYGAEDRTYTYTSFREGTCSKIELLPLNIKYMERKIGFTPISHSGKECVLRVELLPHRKLMERKIGLAPIPRSGKERVLRVELLPHDIKWSGR